MSDERVLSQATPAPSTGGGPDRIARWGSPHGAGVSSSELDALVARGLVFTVHAGTASTPVTSAGAFAATTPDLLVDVPDGTSIRPLFLSIHYETPGTTLLRESFASVSTALGVQTGGTGITPVNMRTRGGGSSNCTATSIATATAQSGSIIEFGRSGLELDEVVTTGVDFPNRTTTWAAGADGPSPLVIGDGSIFVYGASQAGTLFITLVYAEFQGNEY